VNNRAGDSANRAVILIAPIIEETAGDPADPVLPPPDGAAPAQGQTSTALSRLLSAVKSMIFSPIEQSRISAFDLALIKSEQVFSRYMISPSRENPLPSKSTDILGPSKSLMSLPLNAAMGFAAPDYRRHDFLLGRRNAQQFLSEHFMLPGDNPLINPNDPWEAKDKRPGLGPGTFFYPIIPVRGAVHQNFEEPLPNWNWQALSDDMITGLVSQFGVRADSIWGKIKSSLTSSGSGSFLSGLGNALFVNPVLAIAWGLKIRPLLTNGFKGMLTDARTDLNPENL
jgi:hypothetical protein